MSRMVRSGMGAPHLHAVADLTAVPLVGHQLQPVTPALGAVDLPLRDEQALPRRVLVSGTDTVSGCGHGDTERAATRAPQHPVALGERDMLAVDRGGQGDGHGVSSPAVTITSRSMRSA